MNETIAILCTNDAHCAIDGGGYAAVAALKRRYAERYGGGNVFLVDAGDCFGGGAVGLLTQGLAPLRLMNACGYDALALGNADFMLGSKRLAELESSAEFPFLCCNFFETGGRLGFPAYAVKDAGGARIAFVGVITPRAVNNTGLAGSSNNFCQDASGQLLRTVTQKAVDAARQEGAEFVVLLSHLGQAGQVAHWGSDALVAGLRGVDAVLDGHSHERYLRVERDLDGNAVPILQAGSCLGDIGVLLIDAATGETSTALEGTASLEKDPGVLGLSCQLLSELDPKLEDPVFEAPEDLMAKAADGSAWVIRSSQTNLGKLVAEAYRCATGADATYAPAWTIRNNIAAGPVTSMDLYEALPLGVKISSIQVSGWQILDLLEYATRFAPEPNGCFPQVSGLQFSFDASIPSSVETDDMGAFAAVSGARRVKDARIGGIPVAPDRLYSLATVQGIAEQGTEGFSMLEGAPVLQSGVCTDVQAVLQLLAPS